MREEGGREVESEGGREGGRGEREREGGREGREREGGKEGGREVGEERWMMGGKEEGAYQKLTGVRCDTWTSLLTLISSTSKRYTKLFSAPNRTLQLEH